MADKKPYIIIKNFYKYQHYQDGSRPVAWVKLHLKILNSERFFRLTEFERWIFIGLLVLAGLKNNKIPYEKKFLKAKILHYGTDEELLDKAIISLKENNLIAIKLLSSCYQTAILEKSRIEKSRVEENMHVEIVEIFDLFKKVNPTINYGHRTNRQVIIDLIKQFDLEKVKKMTEFAVSVQGKQFAPTITTPWQLKEKLGALGVYWKRENIGKGREIIFS